MAQASSTTSTAGERPGEGYSGRCGSEPVIRQDGGVRTEFESLVGIPERGSRCKCSFSWRGGGSRRQCPSLQWGWLGRFAAVSRSACRCGQGSFCFFHCCRGAGGRTPRAPRSRRVWISRVVLSGHQVGGGYVSGDGGHTDFVGQDARPPSSAGGLNATRLPATSVEGCQGSSSTHRCTPATWQL